MSGVKTSTPIPHPAESLSNAVPEEIKLQFLKTPKFLSIEYNKYYETLSLLRNDFKYCYIVEWFYLMKHFIKLYDAFDVENFEEELLGIAPPSFINNSKTKLIQYLKNEKMQNIDMEFDFFVDQIYQDYELIEIDDEDKKNEESDDSVDHEESQYIKYSTLPLLEQIDVLYNLIKLCNTKSFAAFRNNVEKYQNPHFDLKVRPIFEIMDSDFKIDYIILQDARLYLRKWKYTAVEIPTNKIDFESKFPDPYNDLLNLEPEMVQWECLSHNIYQFDAYITNLRKSFGKKYSSDEYKLSKVLEENIDFIIQHDLKKRKQSAQRKREIDMQMLMANRKRSSRIEEKEKRKREQDEARLKELELMKVQAAELRASKRQKLKETNFELSREDRMKKRQDLAIENSGVDVVQLDVDDSLVEIKPIDLNHNQFQQTADSSQIIESLNQSEIIPSLNSTEQTLESQDIVPATAHDDINTSNIIIQNSDPVSGYINHEI